MSLPLTYGFELDCVNDKGRMFVFNEFAENGAKHLVLSNYLLGEVMRKAAFADVLQKEMAACGLSFCDAHAPYGPYYDLFLPEGKSRQWMLTCQTLAIKMAAAFGIKVMAMHTGDRYDFTDAYTQEELHGNILRSLDILLPVAEQYGITLAMENTYYPPNSPENLIAIAEHFKSANLGICYDSGHANLLAPRQPGQETPPIFEYAFEKYSAIPYDRQFLEKVLPYVVSCHLHDNDGIRDRHLLMDDPAGTVNWPHVMTLLSQAPRLMSYQCEALPVREHFSISRMTGVFSELCETKQVKKRK